MKITYRHTRGFFIVDSVPEILIDKFLECKGIYKKRMKITGKIRYNCWIIPTQNKNHLFWLLGYSTKRQKVPLTVPDGFIAKIKYYFNEDLNLIEYCIFKKSGIVEIYDFEGNRMNELEDNILRIASQRRYLLDLVLSSNAIYIEDFSYKLEPLEFVKISHLK